MEERSPSIWNTNTTTSLVGKYIYALGETEDYYAKKRDLCSHAKREGGALLILTRDLPSHKAGRGKLTYRIFRHPSDK